MVILISMITESVSFTRLHARRLREVYRSAGWPCQDMIEVELLAGGLLERVGPSGGHETLRLTDAGLQALAGAFAGNRQARSAHEALVERVAREMVRAGRVAWRGLALRARVPAEDGDSAWVMACPDVFSIRNTTVAEYVEPVVHEIKVSRADLLGDLKKPAKRAAYLDLGGECWYVLGQDGRGRCIGTADDVPPECGVMAADGMQLTVLRPAPRREAAGLPFQVWMALAKATPLAGLDDETQGLLGEEG